LHAACHAGAACLANHGTLLHCQVPTQQLTQPQHLLLLLLLLALLRPVVALLLLLPLLLLLRACNTAEWLAQPVGVAAVSAAAAPCCLS
jgi:hypothetical protein